MKPTLPPTFGLKNLLIIAAATVFGPVAAFGATQFGKQVRPDPEAVAAANRWFGSFDTANYRDARHLMAARIQRGGATTEEQWVAWAKSRRQPLGRPLSRGLTQARYSNTMPGAPDGNYEVLYYKTSFQRKAQGVEVVTLTKESGHWEVSGYGFK